MNVISVDIEYLGNPPKTGCDFQDIPLDINIRVYGGGTPNNGAAAAPARFVAGKRERDTKDWRV